MEAGEELTVTMEMDWKAGASKDFSLVSWATGSQPVSISSDYSESDTFQGAMPFTVAQATDSNAANESGADICAANPQLEGFNNWVAGFDAFSMNSCASSGTW